MIAVSEDLEQHVPRLAARRSVLGHRSRSPGAIRDLQELVDEGDGHAALADRGGDALDRAEADVAAREDARNARLQQIRVAIERPALR